MWSNDQNFNNNTVSLVNFYHPLEDQALININSKNQKLLNGSHKKNQLSLQSNKAASKVLGYIQTASTH